MNETKETRELLTFIATFTSTLGKALEDGRIDVADMAAIFTTLTKLPAAMKDIQKIPRELETITTEEKQRLLREFTQAFNIPNDKAEIAIELSIEIALTLIQLLQVLKR